MKTLLAGTNFTGIKMKITIHTKYGVFESVEAKYNEEGFTELSQFLEKIHSLNYFSMVTTVGEIYMTEGIIADSLFILQK
jgi:hypothetical protein